MYKVIKKSESILRQIAPNKTANNYITKDINPLFSLATTKGDNYYEKVKVGYNRVYFVLEGELILNFDKKQEKLNVGDCIYIEKNTTYEMTGTFNAIVINQPAFSTLPDKN